MSMRYSGIKLKRVTKLTIFSTALTSVTILFLYMMMVVEFEVEITPLHLMLFLLVVPISYMGSALVIDKTLNPLRQMISKVNEIGNMNFSIPLIIDADDDELQEYVAAFNTMSLKLNRYIEGQNRFISDASHELATPITAINGHADLLLRRGKDNPELIDNGLAVIKTEILKMDRLVDSLLLLARSDSGRQIYEFELADLSKLIEESIAEVSLTTENFTFESNIPANIHVRCDEYAIRRVLRILLSNAIKYAGDNRLVQIQTTASHEMVEVVVADKGTGIDAVHLPRIFERFYRVDSSRSQKTGGSGLGLAIAKEIIEAHGGKIHAHSRLGEGTEFHFTL